MTDHFHTISSKGNIVRCNVVGAMEDEHGNPVALVKYQGYEDEPAQPMTVAAIRRNRVVLKKSEKSVADLMALVNQGPEDDLVDDDELSIEA